MATTAATPLFRNLDAEDAEATTIESVCMNCFKNGNTRMLLTKIPFYKEVVLMSFHCEHCGFENNEIQSASEIQPKGCKIRCKITTVKDLNRRIVKSDHTLLQIPEVDLEIPSQSQKGEVTTIEGIIERTIAGLEQDQEARRKDHPEVATQIEKFITSLRALKLVESPFTIILKDISGNCFIENPLAPQTDPHLEITHFKRTNEQDKSLGMYRNDEVEENAEKESQTSLLNPIAEGSWPLEELHGEVMQFQTLCSECRSPCETNMKLTNIPHFKEVVIMATVCDVCGCKTNEVKSGGGIEETGVKFEVTIATKEDLTRDVLKSETCSLRIPELDCEVGSVALGGRFSTVEGILIAMKDQLYENGATFRDSQDQEERKRFERFLEEIQKIISLEQPATLILDDPAGNSYIQSLTDDDSLDSGLKITRYTRSFEQNEELGLNDMKTENY